MKCEVYLEQLEEYLDGELLVGEQEKISRHLITCTDCSTSFARLTAEQELFDRYDREFEVSPFLWTRIAEDTVARNNSKRLGWRTHFFNPFATPAFTRALAILLIAFVIGVVYLISRQPESQTTAVKQTNPTALPEPVQDRSKLVMVEPDAKSERVVSTAKPKRRARPTSNYSSTVNQSDILSSDIGYLDMDERDTAKHIEQTQNLLRSIRNFPVSDGDEEIDVTYDKALSRRLLNENVILRRDAEMKAKFPTKTLLSDLEPFLIDIANLPDHARPEDVRVIKERVQKTEIVAALMGYQDRGPNNR